MKRLEHTCKVCRKVFHGSRSRKYCSRACHYADRPPSWNAGKKGTPSRAKTQVVKVCQQCGADFAVHAHRAATALYCSMACYRLARWGEKRSETRVCGHCLHSFNTFKGAATVFCSKQCYGLWQSKHTRGKKSPVWKGGTSRHYRRGADWYEAAAAARARDNYTCQRCGIVQSALTGKRKQLDVHHIIPYAVTQSNALSNLLTLCRSCHGQLEPSPAMVKALKRRAKAGQLLLPLF